MPKLHRWVICLTGRGQLHEEGQPENRTTKFETNSVALVKEDNGETLVVWVIGKNQDWTVPASEIQDMDIIRTGDKFDKKICNVCHRLLVVDSFEVNQTNAKGEKVRRPSCIRCRADIDKRAPKSNQAKWMESRRPKIGSPFKCPICQKRSIAGVTAKIVADHDHLSGNIRDFICESCNTGLGRFKNGEDYLHNAISYLQERDTLNVGEPKVLDLSDF